MVVFMKRRQLAAAALGVLAALTLLFVIPGCQRDSGGTEPVQAADNAARVAYLESLGWQVTPEPLETLTCPPMRSMRPCKRAWACPLTGAAAKPSPGIPTRC